MVVISGCRHCGCPNCVDLAVVCYDLTCLRLVDRRSDYVLSRGVIWIIGDFGFVMGLGYMDRAREPSKAAREIAHARARARAPLARGARSRSPACVARAYRDAHAACISTTQREVRAWLHWVQCFLLRRYTPHTYPPRLRRAYEPTYLALTHPRPP